MEKYALIALLLLGLLLLGCKGKVETDETNYTTEDQSYDASQQHADAADSTSLSPAEMATIKAYQYSWSNSDKMPPLVIVIDDFGQSAGQLLEDFAALPREVAFAILPDLPHTQTAARLADKTNHEVLIHIPMQAVSSSTSPGKRYIKAGMEKAEIADLLQEFYAQIPNAIAANNHMGSASTADFSTMLGVLDELNELGLLFLDSATTNKSAVPSAAAQFGLKTAKRDIFLDVPDNSDATLISKIQSLGKYKGRNEPVVIITHCHNRDKLLALQKFIAQITDMGIELIPLSKMFKRLSPPA